MAEYSSVTIDESANKRLEQLQERLENKWGVKVSKKSLTEFGIEAAIRTYRREYGIDMDEQFRPSQVGFNDDNEESSVDAQSDDA